MHGLHLLPVQTRPGTSAKHTESPLHCPICVCVCADVPLVLRTVEQVHVLTHIPTDVGGKEKHKKFKRKRKH